MVPLTRSPIHTRATTLQGHNRSPSGSDDAPEATIRHERELPPHRELSSQSRAA
ncbi:hypothetical protein PGT21_029423 [Puccinia graminis f. sp. tritici]|uniref:Uncharacterized protein n=1 Tax=Puccinia graminis f. sp. tritici TaxID=56615 RepID=A0A5B0RAS1_PUCGR|nr:hypothetical protein PGT21_029423 [Puccinia graminis f. sp. tritici]KAA1122442.1 hypothetical protein PGTUg99_037610 [Puccinia graminis f. sp. tritici]